MNKLLLILCLAWLPASLSAQLRSQKQILLTRALKAFNVGASLNGLHILKQVMAEYPVNDDLLRTYRMQASLYAMTTAEQCDLYEGASHCDSALKYAEEARELGDSSVYHEVLANALYNKLVELEANDFNDFRDNMPDRILTRDVCYRYLPESKKMFYKELISKTIAEVKVARGDLDKRAKLHDLSNKMRTIERSQRMVGLE